MLPSIAPFAAVLFLFLQRWQLRRLDIVFALSLIALTVPLLIHVQVPYALASALQLLAAWLLFRSFNEARSLRSGAHDATLIMIGLQWGLAMVVLLGFLNMATVNPLAKISQAIVWESTGALYGHTVLTLGALIAVLAPSDRYRFISLFLSSLGILVSGSGEAAFAWILITLALVLLKPTHSTRGKLRDWALLSIVTAVATGLVGQLGLGHFGFRVDLAPTNHQENLLHGTEIAGGDWWFEQGVRYESGTVAIDGTDMTLYRVRKLDHEPWRRLQQLASLRPNLPYTISAWIRTPAAGSDLQPGLQGWAQTDLNHETFSVIGSLYQGQWQARLTGQGHLLSAGSSASENDEWQRVWITFVYEGSGNIAFWPGMAPDQRPETDTEVEFAGFQLEQSATVGEYTPGPATQGLGIRAARLPYWHTALQGALERPLLGHGAESFSDYYSSFWRDSAKLSFIPSHAHNLPLQILFDRGLIGLLGLILLVGALFSQAIAKMDAPLIAVGIGLLVANLLDYTLLYGGVLYPLAAVAGWRSGIDKAARSTGEEVTRQGIVRLVLAMSDFLMALVSLAGAQVLTGWLSGLRPGGVPPVGELPGSVYYALLLWPLIAWREGLYPSYGLTPSQELRRQVTSVIYAGLLLATGTLLIPDIWPVPRTVLLLTVALSIPAVSVGRALTKRLLHSLCLWGTPVVVLGAGSAGQRVASALASKPLDGLHPVAFFDDDTNKIGRRLAGLPVKGDLGEADAWAERNGVRRAIVTITKASPEVLTRILKVNGKAFQKIQFVPDLAGLPVLGIQTSSIDNLLALEVRNELASPVNRFLKRTVDLLLVTIGSILVVPMALALAIAIYVDSPGPVIFGHRRVGRAGRTFMTWKFRTMVPDADRTLTDYLNRHPELRAQWESHQKLQTDPRVTRVGRFLRKTSLDELPQLFNVLIGEMSLVGPRPIVQAEVVKYAKIYDLYKMVRPGLTGYWQVSGRSNTDYTQRVELDSFYVRNWSLWLDVIILLRTVKVVLRGDGAW